LLLRAPSVFRACARRPDPGQPLLSHHSQHRRSGEQPQVIEDQEHERSMTGSPRSTCKDSGMVCTVPRTVRPAPGAARCGRQGRRARSAAGPPARPGRHRDRHARVNRKLSGCKGPKLDIAQSFRRGRVRDGRTKAATTRGSDGISVASAVWRRGRSQVTRPRQEWNGQSGPSPAWRRPLMTRITSDYWRIWLAARRLVVFRLSGGIWRIFLGPMLTQIRKVKGTTACQETSAAPMRMAAHWGPRDMAKATLPEPNLQKGNAPAERRMNGTGPAPA